MCGIVGYSGKSNFDADKLKILFLYNQPRGEESAGFYTNDKSEDFGINRIEKTMGKASEKLIPKYDFEPTNLFIGHVRKSSRGANTINNAHPFLAGKYVGVHNGTFSNFVEVARAFEIESSNSDVDSKAFYHVLNKVGDPYEAIGYFEGGAALVFTQEDKQDTLTIYRNATRPLFRGTIKDENGDNCIYISSVEEGLNAIGCDNVKEFTEERIYTIENGSLEFSPKHIVKKDLPKDNFKEIFETGKVKVLHTFEDYIETSKEQVGITNAYTSRYTFSNGTVAVEGTHTNITEKIERVEFIFCEIRKEFYVRVHYVDNAGYNSKDRFFEIPIPQSIMGTGKPAATVADEVLDDELKGVATLMYEIYGTIQQASINVQDAISSGKTEDLDPLLLVEPTTVMERFLAFTTD